MNPLLIGALALAVLSASIAQVHARPSVRLIFRCEQGGVLTFADHPCGSHPQAYEPDASRVSTYEGTAVRASARPVARPRPDKRSAAKGSIAADQAKHVATCAKLAGSLRDVREKMRTGYKAKDGVRLESRQAKLTGKSRAQRCR